ncbi:hypothetical protein [Ruegeria sp. SCP11]|uniref:hypothetical protein n=1 Tax=Ruegeria sp. SCP11 TaxID=3141378 RepID=UPI00333AFA22
MLDNTVEPEWFGPIKQRSMHLIVHDTSFEAALGILKQRQIHGVRGNHTSHEGFPHFLYDGWPQMNHLPTRPQIRLSFEVTRPARLRGQGVSLPEPNYLEVYQNPLGDPWQCSLHPEGPELVFVGSSPDWRVLQARIPPWTTRGGWSEASRELRRLVSQLRQSENENRKIRPALV